MCSSDLRPGVLGVEFLLRNDLFTAGSAEAGAAHAELGPAAGAPVLAGRLAHGWRDRERVRVACQRWTTHHGLSDPSHRTPGRTPNIVLYIYLSAPFLLSVQLGTWPAGVASSSLCLCVCCFPSLELFPFPLHSPKSYCSLKAPSPSLMTHLQQLLPPLNN